MPTPIRTTVRLASLIAALLLASVAAMAADTGAIHRGYYRFPAVHGDTIVFTSEGDLWSVSTQGGPAHRLTSNTGTESMAAISPDGQIVAFAAEYEGPREVYTMPIGGGLPQRQTWDGDAVPAGWTPDGRLMVRTRRYSTLPDPKLVLLNLHGGREIVPLASASEGAYSADGHTLFFTRWEKQVSRTKRYQGGWGESVWRYDGKSEATAMTADWAGTSHNPMFSEHRVYFLSDRDGVMNVYSTDEQGRELKQQSHQHTFDIESASLSEGNLVYASGGDLWLLDLKTGHDHVIGVTLVSDFDQLREHWVKKPLDYLTAVHLAPDGNSALFTARGEVFSLPAKSGRIIKVAGNSAVRYREARFLPDGKGVVLLSTESGETEFWKYPASGSGAPEQWTHDAKLLRWDGVPSPDGRWLAHHDKDQQLWIFDTKTRQNKRIAQSMMGDFSDLNWSPDSQWLAYVESASNQFAQIKVLNVNSGAIQPITSERYNSNSPAWSADGKWLYFLSDRMLQTTVSSPWGSREPEPHFDRPVKVYQVALMPDLRSPFLPADELHPETPAKKDEEKTPEAKPEEAKKNGSDTKTPEPLKSADQKKDEKKPVEVKIDFSDIASRLTDVPAPPGNYGSLQATDKRLCWTNSSDEVQPKLSLQCLDIANKGDELETLMGDVKGYELSLDRKKLLVAKADEFYIFDSDVKASATGDAKTMGKAAINLSRWAISTNPREEFRGFFLDAWRLERDYFYDRHMHGVDWNAMRERYLPLVDRVADREELNEIIAQMVSELSALHTFVQGGDMRKPEDQIDLAALGAVLRRDEKVGGYIVDHVYLHDPDLPNAAPPLARPESLVHDGEVIVTIDGVSALSVPDERALLRGKAGTQVMLQVKSSKGQTREVLVTPVKADDESKLRYAEWEYSRRLKVDADSAGQIGYVHLRAMGTGDMNQWARDYYPVFDRQGLIIDVRHNHGGNIDPWLLGKLLRQAWFYWQPRVGNPQWNMQYAFRGHIVVLCDQETASDGEAFTAGFHHFNLGKVIGIRTWGGEIWLSGDNVQADNGVATAAETGVYTPDGKWLIEGHGFDPDIVVDNAPHGTFTGEDAQLQAALELLKKEIHEDPRPVPKVPPYPDKSFKYQP